MKLLSTFVTIVTWVISSGFSLLAADEENVAAQSPSRERSPATSRAQEKSEVLPTSPGGAVRLERIGDDILVVSTKDPAQRAKLPTLQILGDASYPDEFHLSPNDEWIFSPYHVGSCLSDAVLYHRINPTKLEMSNKFTTLAWQNAVKQGAFKRNFLDDGMCAMIGFECWSIDSARLLIYLLGGEELDTQQRYLYFNTRKEQFEVTDYLRKLNKSDTAKLVCAEPVDALPSEAELKTRFDALDQQLNKRYAEVVASTGKERVANVREAQRNWIKHRDEDAKFYVSLFPAVEKEQRRLQFLCEVTAARIDTQADEQWEL